MDQPTTPTAVREISDSERHAALRRVNHRGMRWVWEWTRSILVTLALIVVVRTFLVDIFRIPSSSMEGTLLVGDILFVNKLAYGAEVPLAGTRLPPLKAPQRGDVVIFDWPVDPSKTFVKRVVGLPGDTLEMRNGRLAVNGRLQSERFAHRTPSSADVMATQFDWLRAALLPSAYASPGAHPTRNAWGPLVVPARHLFVLGDNRDNSSDSRYWGFVPDSALRGQPILIYYSVAPDSLAPGPWFSRVRWRRIGEWVE